MATGGFGYTSWCGHRNWAEDWAIGLGSNLWHFLLPLQRVLSRQALPLPPQVFQVRRVLAPPPKGRGLMAWALG
jgi:hypothetical protein